MSTKSRGLRDHIRAVCRERGIQITPLDRAYWLHGRGVDILCLDLADVAARELFPPTHGRPGVK